VGAKLRYHGDFDWAGITIGNYVIREYARSNDSLAFAKAAACLDLAPGINLRSLTSIDSDSGQYGMNYACFQQIRS
jgi:hypothetical protein